MTTKSDVQKGLGSSPVEYARALVEHIYSNFPACPLCGSDEGYDFSGWFHDYIRCRNCRAKWEVDLSGMRLVEPPHGVKPEMFQETIDKKMSFDSWKTLRFEGIGSELTVRTDSNEMISCSRCGSLNPIANNFCGNCGGRLAQIVFNCPRCGEENKAEANFCKKCGMPLESDETQIY